MRWLKAVLIAIATSAIIAALFSYGLSDPAYFLPWFAFALACSVGNGLIMTPTATYAPGKPETTVQTFSGQTIHSPRIDRLKDPAIVALLIVLFGVLAWIFLR